MREAKDILFDFIRSRIELNFNLLEVYNKYKDKEDLTILVSGVVPEVIYWLVASLPAESITFFADIREVNNNFTYMISELNKRNLPVQVFYKTDKLSNDYDLTFSGNSLVKLPVSNNVTIHI